MLGGGGHNLKRIKKPHVGHLKIIFQWKLVSVTSLSSPPETQFLGLPGKLGPRFLQVQAPCTPQTAQSLGAHSGRLWVFVPFTDTFPT